MGVYHYKTQSEEEYSRLLTCLNLVNGIPGKVEEIVGALNLYRSNQEETLPPVVYSLIKEVQQLAQTVEEKTDREHEYSIYAVQGIGEIVSNLEEISDRVILYVQNNSLTTELLEDVELLNILIDVVKQNTSRYVISELTYNANLKEVIAKRNGQLKLFLLVSILLTVALAGLSILIIRKSVTAPIFTLEEAMAGFRERGEYDAIVPKNIDEIGSLTVAVNEMVDTVRLREDALVESEKKFRNFYKMAPVLLHNIDLKGCLIEVNDTWLRALGYKREEVIGTNSLHYYSETSQEKLSSLYEELLEKGVVQDVKLQLVSKSGETRDIRLTAHMERDGEGRYNGARAASIDVTERNLMRSENKKLEQQLIQSQKLESIGRLAGGVAHDLNNLLVPILGFSDLLSQDPTIPKKQREQIVLIYRAGGSARDLVGQLLAFSRRQALEVRHININETIQGYEKLLRRTIRENISIKMILTSGLPNVAADKGQIQQVIMNLSVNASDAMPEGGVLTIETQSIDLDGHYVKTHPGISAGKYVRILFRDTGVGMDATTTEQVFEPFFSTKGELGTGLGLSTVYGIIKQHKGDITVYSEPGKGTIFNVFLPVVEAPNAEDQTIAAELPAITGSETILLAEDNEQLRIIARKFLEDLGYKVLVAEDGLDAERIATESDEEIHLLLTDVIMPGVNGKELSEHLLAARPEIKVIFMSGYTDDIIATQGVLESGVVFLQKPFTQRSLGEKIREALG